MEKFAICAFNGAINADSFVDGAAGREAVARRLECAAIYLDLLAQFHDGVLPPPFAKASQYANDRSGHILSCLLSSTDPEPPKPPSLNMGTRSRCRPSGAGNVSFKTTCRGKEAGRPCHQS